MNRQTDYSLPSIQKTLQEQESWEEKYEYLIEIGSQLTPLDPSLKTEENRVKSCQSRVWIHGEIRNNQLFFVGESDSVIVKGLLYLVILTYSGLSPKQVLSTNPVAIQELNIAQNLSMTRALGLESMIQRIKQTASQFL